MKFFKSRYYPLNIDTKIIVNEPFQREKDCAWKYRGKGFIGIKGERLNQFACYKEYRVIYYNGLRQAEKGD